MRYFAVYNMYMSCAFIRESTVRSYVHIKETSNEKGRKKVKKRIFWFGSTVAHSGGYAYLLDLMYRDVLNEANFYYGHFYQWIITSCVILFDICFDWYCVSLIQHVHTHPVCAYGMYIGECRDREKNKLRLLVYYKEQQGSGGQRTCNNKQCQCHPIVQKDTLLFLSFFLLFCFYCRSRRGEKIDTRWKV